MAPALLWLLLALAPAPPPPFQDGDPPKVEAGGEEGEEGDGGDMGEEEDPGDTETGPRKSPAAAPKPPALPVRAALPGSTAAVCITVCDFRPEIAEEGKGDPDEPSLLFGHIGEGRTTLALTAERDEPKRPAAGRRDREAKRHDPAPAVFEVAGVPCLVIEAVYPEAPGAKQFHFHAFPAAAGWSFDLHVSTISFVGKPTFERKEFEAIVKTLRFGWFRRGFPELMPPPVAAAMDGAARRTPGEARFLEDAVKSRPGDGALRLALGEALLAADRPEPAAGAFEKGIELLAAGSSAEAKKEDRFALWLALDGAATASLRIGKADRARAWLVRAKDLAATLDLKELKAATAYGLARCAGEKGEGSAAAALLAEAIALDPALRTAAKDEGSFRKVRLSKEFRAALGE